MGTVRPDHVKRAAHKIFEQFPSLFTRDFEYNKRIVDEVTRIGSKKLRNRVTGYLTTLIKREYEIPKNSEGEIHLET